MLARQTFSLSSSVCFCVLMVTADSGLWYSGWFWFYVFIHLRLLETEISLALWMYSLMEWDGSLIVPQGLICYFHTHCN